MTFNLPSSRPKELPEPRRAASGEAQPGFTARAFFLSILLTVLCGFWVRQAEIVVLATQITEAVPSIPAIAALLILVVLNPLLFRFGPRWGLSRSELLSIYCFVSIAISMSACGVIRFWVSLVTTPFYIGREQHQFDALFPYIPRWLAVKDPRLIHDLYERGPSTSVPWGAWAVPLLAWTAFLMALWFCMLCMVRLVRRRWIDAERLSFPIVALPLDVTGDSHGQPPFLRNPLMWAGFSLAVVYNGLNILNAFFPTIPCPGKSFDLGPVMTAEPWKSLGPLTLHFRPELVGFGFLVPSEICFSIWFFYLLSRMEALAAHLAALDFPGAPFEQEQSIGAYLLLGAWFLWLVREDIATPLKEAWRTRRLQWNHGEPPLWCVVGLAASFVFACGFCRAAGMATWVAVAYLGIVLLTALVSARVRAEAGVPLIWLFPFYQQKKILLYTLGTSAFMVGGLPATLTIFAMLTFLSRGFFPAFIGYQVESLKIGEEAKISRGRMSVLILVAALVGLAVAYYMHLSTYYQYGAQNLGGIWGSWMSPDEYSSVLSAQMAPKPADPARTGATAFGALFTLVLVLLRRAYVGFPLHPLGYAVATSYGSLVWWSFLVVWILKTLILKWGGIKMYRRAIPFFLGFALGHFFAAGIVWGLLGAFWPDAAHAYGVWFG